MDEIQMADEGQGRFMYGFGRQGALATVESCHPLQAKLFRHVAEQGCHRNAA